MTGTVSRFDPCLTFTLQWEGARFTDDPHDPGGASRYGVTQTDYDRYRRGRNLPSHTVRDITGEEVHGLYRALYWEAAHCPDLPVPLDAVQFDTSVNMGVRAAMEFLQHAVGAPVDGSWGPRTREAVAAAQTSVAVTAYLDGRVARYQALARDNPGEHRYLKGWISRVNALRRFADGAQR